MRYRIPALTFLLWQFFALPALPKGEPISAEGPVVAIQRSKDDTRVVDPSSLGDLAEIYMVRFDRWSQPRKEKYIIIEYVHRADLISYDQFDKTLWNIELQQATSEESKECFTWMTRGPSFVPTAFGAKAELPNPKALPCFLMTKRPVPVSHKRTTH
jgi:hypothetical protein